MSRRNGAIFLLANLLSLIVFSVFAFRQNEVNLMHGLDGSYFMTIGKQQALWGSGSPWGLTSNVFQSLGNVWFPLKTTLMPEYAIPLMWNHGEPAPVAYFVAFAAEAFLAAYLLGLCLGRGAGVAAAAGWILALTVMPYFGLPKIYPTLALIPHLMAIRFLTVLAFLLFRNVGRVGPGGSVASLVAVLVILVYSCLSEPIFSVLLLPIIAATIIALVVGAESGRERREKVAGCVLGVAVLAAAGLPQFLYGLYRYTAAAVFRPELFNADRGWYFVSIAFQAQSHGMTGPILFALAVLGGVVFAWTGRGLPRLFAVVMLSAMASILAFGALAESTDAWQGPSPIYFEILLWPFYAVYAVGLLHVLGTRLVLLARRAPPSLTRGSILAVLRSTTAVCLACAGLPWILLGVQHTPAGVARLYPYPPRLTPIVKTLKDEIALQPGDRFRGRVATLTPQSVPRPALPMWFYQSSIDNEFLARFGNDHRTVGLWYYNIPTLFEYNQFITPPFYLVTRAFLAYPGDAQIRNVMALRKADGRVLRLLGVRFVIVDSPVSSLGDARLRLRLDGSPPLLLYELEGSNLGTYSPVNALVARSARDAITKMAREVFDPRQDVVVDSVRPSKLVPITSSAITIARDGLHVVARSTGTSLLLLPFEYSRCLDIKETSITGIPAQVFRADLVETGILFDRQIEAVLTYDTGLVHHSSCRIEDSRDMETLGMVPKRR